MMIITGITRKGVPDLHSIPILSMSVAKSDIIIIIIMTVWLPSLNYKSWFCSKYAYTCIYMIYVCIFGMCVQKVYLFLSHMFHCFTIFIFSLEKSIVKIIFVPLLKKETTSQHKNSFSHLSWTFTKRKNLAHKNQNIPLFVGRCSADRTSSIWSPFLLNNRSPNGPPHLGSSSSSQQQQQHSSMQINSHHHPTMKSASDGSGSRENGRENRDKNGNGSLTCPVCLISLKPSEVNAHFYKEVHDLETYRNALR